MPEKTIARHGGNQSGGDTGRWAGGSSVLDSTPSRAARQESPETAHWRGVADLAKLEGDRQGYLLARRVFLLSQAVTYAGGA